MQGVATQHAITSYNLVLRRGDEIPSKRTLNRNRIKPVLIIFFVRTWKIDTLCRNYLRSLKIRFLIGVEQTKEHNSAGTARVVDHQNNGHT